MAQQTAHLLDLKIPLGGLLSFYGLLLVVYGVIEDPAMYDKSFGMNVNLFWGLVMLVAGGTFVVMHWIRRKPSGGA